MKSKRPPSVDPEYLRHCRNTTAEQRLDWLAEAAEFAFAPKKMRKSIKR